MNPSRFSLAVGAALLLALPLLCGAQAAPAPASSEQKMSPQTRILVMRDFTAEHCFTRHLFPMGTTGLEIKNGQVAPKDKQLEKLIAEHGLAAKPGDRVVISNVEVTDKSIVMEINGGPKRKEKWYKHIQVGAGGTMSGSRQQDTQNITARGSMVTLAFDKYVPELTGDQLREMLAPVFDFKALTVAEAYEKTLPPKVQQAIKDHQVLVGMNREMVTYAKGRAPHKVRDKDDKGQDYEEWIYGDPPQEVDFVRFNGDLVTRLEIMTVDGQKIVRTDPEVHLEAAETEVAQQKPAEKSANAPSLLRPGEQPETPSSNGTRPSTPNPNPNSTSPPNVPHQNPPI